MQGPGGLAHATLLGAPEKARCGPLGGEVSDQCSQKRSQALIVKESRRILKKGGCSAGTWEDLQSGPACIPAVRGRHIW